MYKRVYNFNNLEENIRNQYQRFSELVAQRIVEWIVNGTLKPGERLKTEELAAKLGVSRSPVREALRILEAAGYLESSPYRGTWVKKLSIEDIEEIYMLREMLEGKAAFLAAKHITSKILAKMEEINQAINECIEEGDYIRQQILNKEFHFTIYTASGKPRLVNLINSLWDSITYCRLIYAANSSRTHKVQEEHQRIIEACKNKDGEKLQRVISELIRSHAQEMIATISKVENQEESNLAEE